MTILEGLNCLPEPYRSQALNNRYPRKDTIRASSIPSCLNTAFIWADSPESGVYWATFFRYIRELREKKGEFYVDSNNMLHRYRPGSYDPDRAKIIFKIRIKRK